MNSIDKIEELFKQLLENSNKLSVILPQLYPIALECKDLVGFCLLYFWGTPLDTNNEVNQLYYQNAKKMMCSVGIKEDIAQKNAEMAMEKYLTMRTVTRDNTQMDPIKIWPAQKLEKFFKQCDERIAELKVPEGLSSIDSYQREQKINLQKLSILSDKTKAENQYAILHQLITSKLAEYQTKLLQERTEEESMEKEIKDRKKVFIVHGHDEGLKYKIARLIENQEIKPVILHEQANQGATIIEKFEKNSDVGAAICLFTADDTGKAKTEQQENTRARQNVVFEAGFFMGSLGRDHVIIIAERGVELPSDMQGIVYTDSKSMEFEVLKELDSMGYTIDLNKLKRR